MDWQSLLWTGGEGLREDGQTQQEKGRGEHRVSSQARLQTPNPYHKAGIRRGPPPSPDPHHHPVTASNCRALRSRR